MKSIAQLTAVALFFGVFLKFGSASIRHIFTLCPPLGPISKPAMAANCVAEKEAIHAIDDAIAETKRAFIDDGKDLNDHPPVDARLDHTGRLHRARQLLDRAPQDISHEEDNGFAQGFSCGP
jgi:hypothetical protein